MERIKEIVEVIERNLVVVYVTFFKKPDDFFVRFY